MAYVPTPTPTSARPLSPRARELSNRIGTVIEEYRKHDPNVSERDVRDALSAARGGFQRGGRDATRRTLAIAILAGIAVAGAVVLAGLERGGGAGVPVILAAAFAAGAIVMKLRRRSD